jgi:hypothetical protein
MVKIDVIPEPSDEERAAILEALAEKPEKPAQAPWQEQAEDDP